jgi:hypothetical protein
MKTSSPNDGKQQKLEPPLPLKPEPAKKEDSTKMLKFRLFTDPTDNTSPTYDFHMTKIDGSESLREGLIFARRMLQVLEGLAVNTAQGKLTMYRQHLSGQALAQFNLGYTANRDVAHERLRQAAGRTAAQANNATDATIQAAINGVPVPGPADAFVEGAVHALIAYMAPFKALAKQKRWLRRFCRKPADMTIREFANHVLRINEEELPHLPPFGADQALAEDELIDVVLNGIPRSWTREMDKLGFDPVASNLGDVLDFCERMEASEDFQPGRDAKKTNSKKDSKSNKKEKSSTEGKYCLLHGDNHTHNTDDCHVLKKQAKNLRRDKDDDKKPSGSYKNKTWKRDADRKTSASKSELAAFVKKQKKELHAFTQELSAQASAKRKADDSSSSSEDEDERSTHSLNAFDALKNGDVNLAEFNYEDMDNLKIDSDDEPGAVTDDISV